MLKDISNPLYWNELWGKNLGSHMGRDPVVHWNKKAKYFMKYAGAGQGSKRIEGVLNFLKKHNVLWKNMNILDIGCGPGTFAIPLAELGTQVTAMDPAPKMLEILKVQIKEKGIQNIEVVQGLWEELDVKEKGWHKKYDLVFASQSPGLRDIETLEKMNECSTQYCFATGFDGKRQMTLYDAYYQENFGRPYMRNSHDIIYLINLLYSLGYRPTVEFLNLNREEEFSQEEFINNLEEILIAEDLEIIEENIQSFFARLPKGATGNVIQNVRQVIGLVLWQPNTL